MTKKIRVGIVGYGQLGKGVERELQNQQDFQLIAIFTRREPKQITRQFSETRLERFEDISKYQKEIHVMILCGNSKKDLWEQTVHVHKWFPTVDSFDVHEDIPTYFEKVKKSALRARTLSTISIGWDPGLFSLHRMLGEALFPEGEIFSFWGKGYSQGHSAAVRRIPGVRDAVQYTLPSKGAIEQIRRGEKITVAQQDFHKRVCYVALEAGVDKHEIERAIKTMPHYFAPYETIVHFVSQTTLQKNHQSLSHGGHVFARSEDGTFLELTLAANSNPTFTATVLIAYARATFRMYQLGEKGARTIFDIPPKLLAIDTNEMLRKRLL